MDSQCKTLSMLQVPLVGHDVSNDEPVVFVPVTGQFSPIPVQTLGISALFFFRSGQLDLCCFGLNLGVGHFVLKLMGLQGPFIFYIF